MNLWYTGGRIGDDPVPGGWEERPLGPEDFVLPGEQIRPPHDFPKLLAKVGRKLETFKALEEMGFEVVEVQGQTYSIIDPKEIE